MSLKDKTVKTIFHTNHPPAAITANPQPQSQQKQSITPPQITNLPKPKPTYHLPPPPAKLYHRLGTQNKAKREVRDGQLFYTTTVKYVVYIRAEHPEKPSTSQLLQPMISIMKQTNPTITLIPFDRSENKLKDPTHIPEDETASEYATMSLDQKTLSGIFTIRSQKTLYHLKQYQPLRSYLIQNRTFITNSKW